MRKMIDKTDDNERRRKTHSKKRYVQPKLLKTDELVQITQGFVLRS